MKRKGLQAGLSRGLLEKNINKTRKSVKKEKIESSRTYRYLPKFVRQVFKASKTALLQPKSSPRKHYFFPVGDPALSPQVPPFLHSRHPAIPA